MAPRAEDRGGDTALPSEFTLFGETGTNSEGGSFRDPESGFLFAMDTTAEGPLLGTNASEQNGSAMRATAIMCSGRRVFLCVCGLSMVLVIVL